MYFHINWWELHCISFTCFRKQGSDLGLCLCPSKWTDSRNFWAPEFLFTFHLWKPQLIHCAVIFLEGTNPDAGVKLGHSVNFEIPAVGYSEMPPVCLRVLSFPMAAVILFVIILLQRGGAVTGDDFLISHLQFRRHLNNLLIQCWAFYSTPPYLDERNLCHTAWH